MKWYNKLTAASIFLLNSLINYMPIEQNKVELKSKPIAMAWFNEKEEKINLNELIEKQEEILNIKHFGIPEIEYANSFKELLKIFPFIKGEYDEINNKIYIYYFNGVENIINHELGHFYADKLCENLIGMDYPQKNSDNEMDIEVKLISEGIAEYFERAINNKEDDFLDIEWPKDPEDFWDIRIIYSGGYHLVKPILDKHKEKGIEYLIFNPPAKEELEDPIKYQERILNELD